jgi:TonB family protein
MKKGTIKTGIKGLAGAAMMALVLSACNNESSSSTASGSNEVTPDTTVAAPVAKKKGKASASKAMEDASATKVVKDKDGIYTKVEVAPTYPGNDQALTDYINGNIVYPDQAIENNVEGTVNVQFVVNDKGEISDVTTIGNKLGYGLEEEAVNVVSKLPKWEPGKVKGKNVKTKLTVPITYKLES